METIFLAIKIALSKIDCHGDSKEENVFEQSSSLPPCPTPLKNCKVYFYCRLTLSGRNHPLSVLRFEENAIG